MTTTCRPPAPIACFGAVHWDVIAHADRTIERDTSTPARLTQKPGGVATNVARALARLRVPTTLVGVTGDDPAGDAIAACLKQDGISAHLLRTPNASTGQYLALHDPDGGLAAACIDDQVLGSAPASFFTEAPRSFEPDTRCFLDTNLPETVLKALVGTSPDTAWYADGVSVAKAPRLSGILAALSIVFVNRAEAAAIAGCGVETSPAELSARLRDMGARAVVITDGASPLHLRHSGETLDLPAPHASIVDVTGAGDALIAGTLAGLARGCDLAASLLIGQQAARLTLESPGAVSDHLSWERIAASPEAGTG